MVSHREAKYAYFEYDVCVRTPYVPCLQKVAQQWHGSTILRSSAPLSDTHRCNLNCELDQDLTGGTVGLLLVTEIRSLQRTAYGSGDLVHQKGQSSRGLPGHLVMPDPGPPTVPWGACHQFHAVCLHLESGR